MTSHIVIDALTFASFHGKLPVSQYMTVVVHIYRQFSILVNGVFVLIYA